MRARQMLDRSISEKAFQETVLSAARLAGWRCYHTYDARRSAPGFPDLVLVRGERLIFAELKTEQGDVRTEQWAWLKALEATGKTEVFVWRPHDWEQIEEALR